MDHLLQRGGDLKTKGQEGHSASGGGGIKMAEYVVGSKVAAQLHREKRRQRKAKLISLHSEELEEEKGGERVNSGGEMDSVSDREVAESGGSVKKAVKRRTTAINLSHLDEEEEDT